MSYQTITSHRVMALDAVRNRAYHDALARIITPDSVVLDLGAGTGVLGLMAARLGARRVYLVEPTSIISVAEASVAANGLDQVVRCLRGRIEDVDIPEPVDVIVSVMTGNFLLNEDLLPVLFAARDARLAPGGHLLPGAAVMEAALVSAPGVHATHVAAWSTPQFGVSLEPGRALAANAVLYAPEGLSGATFLSDTAALLSMDFRTAGYEPLAATVTFEVTQAGECHGIAGWFRIHLGDTWLSTSPAAPRTHWSPAFLPIDPPLAVVPGQQVTLSLNRQPRGDWSWRLRSGSEVRRHSTLLSMPMDADALLKASRSYVPARTDDVATTGFVLAAVDGVRDASSIAASLQARFPERFASVEAALEFTQAVLARF